MLSNSLRGAAIGSTEFCSLSLSVVIAEPKGIGEVSAAVYGKGGGRGESDGASKNNKRIPPTSSLPDSALLGIEDDLSVACPLPTADREVEVEVEEEAERRSPSDAFKAIWAPSFALSSADEEEDGKDSRAEGRITTYTTSVATLSASVADKTEVGRGRKGKGVSKTGTVHCSSEYRKHWLLRLLTAVTSNRLLDTFTTLNL